MTRAELDRDLVIVACAISAGIHAALTPVHVREGIGAGVGFAAAAGALVVLAFALTRRPAPGLVLAAGAAFAGLLVAYLLAVATGLPALHPEPEPVDWLAAFTKAIEAVGLLAAADSLRRVRAGAPTLHRPRGTSA